MSDHFIDPAYLRYQYGDAGRLRVRQETHLRFSERADDLVGDVLAQLDMQPGMTVLDVGCGRGTYHAALAARGARIIGVDLSAGMAREAAGAARTGDWSALVAQADAARLPLRDGSLDRAMANHMLYHAPDPPAVLRELRRVVRPGGRVVITLNIAGGVRRLHELHAEAARALGYTPLPATGEPVSMDDLDILRAVFPSVERIVRPNALLFPDAAAALPYYASGVIDALVDAPSDGSHRAPLLSEMERRIDAIVAREGVLRVPKGYGMFVAARD